MPTTGTDTRPRCSIFIVISTLIFIIIVVIVGLCVRFLTEGKVQQIILIVLICLLAITGMSSLITLAVWRRRATKKTKKVAVADTRAVTYKAAPTAPPMSNTSSWNYSKNYSNRSTATA